MDRNRFPNLPGTQNHLYEIWHTSKPIKKSFWQYFALKFSSVFPFQLAKTHSLYILLTVLSKATRYETLEELEFIPHRKSSPRRILESP